MSISNKFQNNSDLVFSEIERNLEKAQHFLRDKGIIEKEVAIANLSKKDRVIEIGAGEGNLTEKLVKRAGKVLVFEIDKRYSEKLEKLKKNYENLDIIYDNALNYSWKNYSKIVSNIPYFISEQLIKKSIEDGIYEIIIIVGERFKEILEKKESKIGILSNLFYNIDFVQKVDKNSFLPPPRIHSWLIKLKRKEKVSSTEVFLASILRKKGKIRNALLYSMVERGKTKRQARKIIEKMNFSKQVMEKPVSRITGRFLIKLAENFEEFS